MFRRASQIPEVNYCAFLPEHGVKRFIGGANAMARCTGNVAVVIDNEANSIQVSGKSRELLNTPPSSTRPARSGGLGKGKSVQHILGVRRLDLA